MAIVVTNSVLVLQKRAGLDPNEDARDLLSVVEKKIAFSLGARPSSIGDDQNAYDN